MDLASWRSQLWKGAAELAVLAALEKKERYGLEILEAAGKAGLEISEGTIYPLLNRLQRDGKVTSKWVEEPGASHPRKYYLLTEDGTRFLALMKEEWTRFATGLDSLLREGDPKGGTP
jgi:PadR family transcriptional regulator, regulatory protein PadR